MTTLVTGATGFIGSAVTRKLLDRGHDVRVLVRAASDRANLDGLKLEIAVGDLADTTSLRRAIHGCSALFHIAADYRLWVPNPEETYRINVDGTRNLMLAALDAGVERIVYTSSVATLGLNDEGSPANEETPTSLDEMIGPYKRSKYLAEEEVKNLVENDELPATIVNPSAPVGPRDLKPTPTGQMILDAAAGRMPAYVDTGLNIVHVDDVASGHLLALDCGKPGRRYILGQQDMSLKEIFAEVAAITGRKPPAVRLPHGLLYPVAWVSERWASATGKPPRVTLDGLRLARKRMYFSSARARAELGYEPRPASDAIRDAVDWFRANGYF